MRDSRCKKDCKCIGYCICKGNYRSKYDLEPIVLTTGVLNTVANQAAAHIELANLDPVETFQIRVQVIQWISGSPVILLDQVVALLPNQHMNLSQNVTPFHYEVRIFHPGSPNVIANTFAIDAGTFTLPGLTFNQKELMKLDLPNC